MAVRRRAEPTFLAELLVLAAATAAAVPRKMWEPTAVTVEGGPELQLEKGAVVVEASSPATLFTTLIPSPPSSTLSSPSSSSSRPLLSSPPSPSPNSRKRVMILLDKASPLSFVHPNESFPDRGAVFRGEGGRRERDAANAPDATAAARRTGSGGGELLVGAPLVAVVRLFPIRTVKDGTRVKI